MATLKSHQSRSSTKALLVGDNGTGKTSSLAALANAGYRLFIQDFDNGLDPLTELVDEDKQENVHFETFRDRVKLKGGKPYLEKGKAEAWAKSSKMLDHWVESETGEDFGSVRDWGPNDVLVVDSLTYEGHAALWKVLADKSRLGKSKRIQDWGDAIELQETKLAMLTDPEVKCNVVLIAHLAQLSQDEDEDEDDPAPANQKRYPTVLGKKLPPRVGSYFNTVIQAKTKGAGSKVRRVIKTTPDPDVDVKVPLIKTDLPAELPVGEALPKLFEKLQRKQ
jgi:hypothetical protein